METPLQELRRRCEGMIESNKKYNSQFHKGLRHALSMIVQAIDDVLLEQEKEQIKNAATSGFLEATMGSQHDPDCFGYAYFEENFTPLPVANSSTDAP